MKTNPDQLAKTLLTLAEKIEYAFEAGEEEKVSLFLTKFNAGLLMLKTVAADNNEELIGSKKEKPLKTKLFSTVSLLRKVRDSNPRNGKTVHRISSAARSTTLATFLKNASAKIGKRINN